MKAGAEGGSEEKRKREDGGLGGGRIERAIYASARDGETYAPGNECADQYPFWARVGPMCAFGPGDEREWKDDPANLEC